MSPFSPVVTSVPPSSSTNRSGFSQFHQLAELIRRSENGNSATTTAAILQQQHQQHMPGAAAVAAAIAASISEAATPATGRRPPRIRRRRVDETANSNGNGTASLRQSTTSTTTTATGAINHPILARTRTMMDYDEPPPLISLEQTTTSNTNNDNTDNITIDNLPQSLVRMYLTGDRSMSMLKMYCCWIHVVHIDCSCTNPTLFPSRIVSYLHFDLCLYENLEP